MDQPKQISVFLVHKTAQESDQKPWARLAKALQGFAAAEIRQQDELISFEDAEALAKEHEFLFLDLEILELTSFKGGRIPNLTVISRSSFSWQNDDFQREAAMTLNFHSCLVLEGTGLSELTRALFLYLNPNKRQVGVLPMMEKGSVIVGEKVQATDAIGSLLDKLSAYLTSLDGFTLKGRIFDLRQVLSGLLFEAFRHSLAAAKAYPTVDFQAGASKNRIAVNLRFPRGKLNLEDITALCIDSRSLFWQQIWQCADILQITHHVQYDELEVMATVHSEAPPEKTFKSILIKSSNRSVKKENLLAAPPNFNFQLLSAIRIKESEQLPESMGQDNSELDLNALPENIVKKLSAFAEENVFLKEQCETKGKQLRDLTITLAQVNKELAQRRNEVGRLQKGGSNKQEIYQRKISELEKQIELLKEGQKQAQAASAESNNTPQLMEAIGRLETSLKASELEKNQIAERAANDLKKFTALEQKYSALYKEAANKDKEIGELKAALIKVRKETATQQQAAQNKSNTGSDAGAAKLKEFEAREAVLKQELRKVTFKLENNEKNVKVIQAEAAEKAKLMEQKLQGAKAKELDLLKRIDELSAALKKASKAA